MVASHDDPDLWNEVRDVSNVLLLASTFSPGVGDRCLDLLGHTSGESDSVLYVVGSHNPYRCFEPWTTRDVAALPRRFGLLTLGRTTRSSSGDGAEAMERAGVDVVVRSVDSPGNLTNLGVELNTFLSDWTSDGHVLAVCFQSLTPLIQYSDVEKVYRFLHVLTNHVEAVEARAHYHLDPGAHGQTEVNLLKTVVDAVVESDDDGGVRIKRR